MFKNITSQEKPVIAVCAVILLAAVMATVYLLYSMVHEPVTAPVISDFSEPPCFFQVVGLDRETVCLEDHDQATLVAIFPGCFCGSAFNWALEQLLPAAADISGRDWRFVFLTSDSDAAYAEFQRYVLSACQENGISVADCPLALNDPDKLLASNLGVVDPDYGLARPTLVWLKPASALRNGEGVVGQKLSSLPGDHPNLKVFLDQITEEQK